MLRPDKRDLLKALVPTYDNEYGELIYPWAIRGGIVENGSVE